MDQLSADPGPCEIRSDGYCKDFASGMVEVCELRCRKAKKGIICCSGFADRRIICINYL